MTRDTGHVMATILRLPHMDIVLQQAADTAGAGQGEGGKRVTRSSRQRMMRRRRYNSVMEDQDQDRASNECS